MVLLEAVREHLLATARSAIHSIATGLRHFTSTHPVLPRRSFDIRNQDFVHVERGFCPFMVVWIGRYSSR